MKDVYKPNIWGSIVSTYRKYLIPKEYKYASLMNTIGKMRILTLAMFIICSMEFLFKRV